MFARYKFHDKAQQEGESFEQFLNDLKLLVKDCGISDQYALCTTRSHGTKLDILVSKLHSGTSKSKAGVLFWKSHCVTCSPVYVILYHVTRACKGPIFIFVSW